MDTPYLRVEDTGAVFELAAEVTTIGRGEGVDVALDDPSVSRLHAELIRRGPHVYVAPMTTPSSSRTIVYVPRGSDPVLRQPPLPPYFPRPPTVTTSPYAPTPYGGSPVAAPYAPSAPSFVASGNAGRHATLAEAPSMSTAMAMSMAYVPAAAHVNALSLAMPIAVPVGLPAPSASMMFGVASFEPPPVSRVPLIVLAIACVLSGALAALVLV